MGDGQIFSEDAEKGEDEVSGQTSGDAQQEIADELQEANQKYLRLYAEFENYKKRVARDKEELVKYGNESLLFELLPAIDNLEMALKHASNDVASGLVQGVEITHRELLKTLEKFGLRPIEAEGKPFDPAVHHAMSQVEKNDVKEKTVVEEFRKGYMLKDKVLRPSLVSVSKKNSEIQTEELEEDTEKERIIIQKNISMEEGS